MTSGTTETAANDLIERMFGAGAHFGYAKSRRHPSMAQYIFGMKQRVEIFDLEKTSVELEAAKAYVHMLGVERKVLLFVGGKPETHKSVLAAAATAEAPYVVGRWIGGTLTNFSEIKKRIARLEDLRGKRDRNELTKYTKLERLKIDREITKLETMYGGIVGLNERLPDALFIVDPKKELTAVREARMLKIPVVALASSDCDRTLVDHVIPANDSNARSIELVVGEIAAAYAAGKRVAPVREVSAAPTATA